MGELGIELQLVRLVVERIKAWLALLHFGGVLGQVDGFLEINVHRTKVGSEYFYCRKDPRQRFLDLLRSSELAKEALTLQRLRIIERNWYKSDVLYFFLEEDSCAYAHEPIFRWQYFIGSRPCALDEELHDLSIFVELTDVLVEY